MIVNEKCCKTCTNHVIGKKIYCDMCMRNRQLLKKREFNKNKNKTSNGYERIYMGHLNQ